MGRGWEPLEARSSLFDQARPTTARGSHVPVGATLRKWDSPRPSAPEAPATSLLPRGVLISLVSMSTTFSAIVEPPSTGRASNMLCAGPAPFVSVSNGFSPSTCSTDGSGVNCSAQWTGAGSAGGACSTGTNAFYCSAGDPGATSGCSTQGASTAKISCSAIGGGFCSTRPADPEDEGMTCSTAGDGNNGGSKQTCSVGAPSGQANGDSGKCSAKNLNPPATSTCSVTNGGSDNNANQNQCSTDNVAGHSCSTLTDNSFCSVTKSTTNASCTILGLAAAAAANCSVDPTTMGGECSVEGGGGPDPVTKLCVAPVKQAQQPQPPD